MLLKTAIYISLVVEYLVIPCIYMYIPQFKKKIQEYIFYDIIV